MLKILDSTAPESKEEGLDVPLNDEMQDVNGVRYKAIRSTNAPATAAVSQIARTYTAL